MNKMVWDDENNIMVAVEINKPVPVLEIKDTEADEILKFIKDDFELAKYAEHTDDLLTVVINMHKALTTQQKTLAHIQALAKGAR